MPSDPATPRRSGWLRLDQYADTERSLRKAAELCAGIERDPAEWKWLLIALHSSLQGMFVLVLSVGGSMPTLKPAHARDWLAAYEEGGPWPKQMDLDFFLELYEKAKHELARATDAGPDLAASPEQDEAMRRLNELRNDFVHFGPQGLSVELAGLPDICLRCLEVAEQLVWGSELVRWSTQAQSNRAHRSLRALRRGLRALAAS